MGKIEGKVAVITGGARGQGRSHAVTLAREGADIVICDIVEQLRTVPYPMPRPEQLDETVRMVQDLNKRCVAVQADVRDSTQMNRVVDRAISEFGKIDILIANAGITSYGRAWELTEQQWDEMIGTNLTGAWQSCRVVIPHMLERSDGGVIVITSSDGGLRGFPTLAHYVAAKHGLVGLMRTLALELAPYNIRVNSVHPTVVNTEMAHNEATYRLFRPDLENPTREDAMAGFQSINLLPVPWVESEDVSNAILWLVSDDARYVTGVTLPVDAGFLIK